MQAGGVYIIVNQAGGSRLELSNGDNANGTHAQGWATMSNKAAYNQLWLLEPAEGVNWWTLRNLRSGTYLELSNGSSDNGTPAQGWQRNTNRTLKENQEWQPTATGEFWILENRRSGTALDLRNGDGGNGNTVWGWQKLDNKNQHWAMQCVSRTDEKIREILHANPSVGSVNFTSYLTPGTSYITLPDIVRQDIWNGTSLNQMQLRSGIFEADDFTFVAKGAVSNWGGGYIRATNVAILFGITFGNKQGAGPAAFNWYLSQEFDKIKFFDPHTGIDGDTPSGFTAFFGLF